MKFAITITIAIWTALILLKVQAQESSPDPFAGAESKSGTTAAQPAATSAASSSTTSAAAQKADTELDGVAAELVSATRTDGDTVTIKFKYSNSGQKETELNLTGYSPDNLAAKIYYIDAKNKKKYLPVTDAAGKPICSTFTGGTRLDPGESKAGWTKFPAPPAGVTTISVYLPGTPPFEGVTLAAK